MNTKTKPGSEIQRKTISVRQFMAEYGLSKDAAYAALDRGDIPSVRIGRRRLIPLKALQAKFGLAE